MKTLTMLLLVLAVPLTAACSRKAAHVYASPLFDPDPNAKAPPLHTEGNDDY